MWAAVMFAQYGVGDVAVRYYLYGAVVVTQLLLCYYVRVVAVYMTIYTDYALHDARYCTYVVRYHDYCHALGKVVKHGIELVLEAIIYKVRGLVEHQHSGLGYHSTTEHNTL